MYPTKEQEILVNKTFGCAGYIYNHFLNIKQVQYKETKKSMSAFECCNELKELTKEYEWLKEVDSCALRNAIFNLEDAFLRMYKKQNEYPNFKNKFNKQSYRTNNNKSSYNGKEYQSIKLDLINRTITLPKLKEITIRGYRNITSIHGEVINATISKEKDGKYYVSVVVRELIEVKNIEKQEIVGLDLGIKDLVVTSDNERYENPKVMNKYEKRLKRLQRELSKKEKGSANYNKCRIKIATVHRKIRNSRKYYLHKITKELTDTKSIIITETLKVKDMVKKSHLAKAIHDASWSELIRQLEYKVKQKGKRFYQISTYYPSSQECSRCGYIEKRVKDLKIRNWECPECSDYHERDYNASVNIMFEGLKKYMLEFI